MQNFDCILQFKPKPCSHDHGFHQTFLLVLFFQKFIKAYVIGLCFIAQKSTHEKICVHMYVN